MFDDLVDNHEHLVNYVNEIYMQIDIHESPHIGKYLLYTSMTKEKLQTATHESIMIDMRREHLLILESRKRQVLACTKSYAEGPYASKIDLENKANWIKNMDNSKTEATLATEKAIAAKAKAAPVKSKAVVSQKLATKPVIKRALPKKKTFDSDEESSEDFSEEESDEDFSD